MVSPGESILRPEATKALGESTVHALNKAAAAGKLPAYASGGVVGSDWSDAVPGTFSSTAGPLLKKLLSMFGKTATTWPRKIGQTGVKRAGPAITEILAGKDKKFMDSMETMAGGAGGAARWSPLVLKVLKELGLSSSYLSLVLHRINVESGGNPKAINLWDSNAQAGHPSQGLMQTIPGTFNAYAGPYKSLGITNPLASIYAGLNYATHRYGSHWTRALSGSQGYWTGTRSASPGLKLVGERGPELVNFKGGERVFNNGETNEMLSGGRTVNLTINEAKSENTTQAALRAFQTLDVLYGNKL
jgi:SLT domain-containing protein